MSINIISPKMTPKENKCILLKTIFIISISLVSVVTNGQNTRQKDYLVCYGQVWGFLKYFHPHPGTEDWDQVLLNDFDAVNQCGSDSAFNTIISNLIGRCGSFEPIKRTIADSLMFKAPFDWMSGPLIHSKNKSYLRQLRLNKPHFKNKYIAPGGAGNPTIKHEADYGTYQSDPAVQFLAIARYWNIINYYYPDRLIILRDWTQVFKDHVLEFVTAKTYEDYYFAVRKLTVELRDGHGFVITKNDPLDEYKYAPFNIIGLSDGYYISSVFQDASQSVDLKKKDKVISIDGISVEEKINQTGTIISTSNDYYLSKIANHLRMTSKDSITLTVERKGVLMTRTYATTEKETLPSEIDPAGAISGKEPYMFVSDSVSGIKYGYINMGILKRSDINKKFESNLSSTEATVIDLRNYPKWTVIKLSDILIKGRKTFAKLIGMNFDYPGSYRWLHSQTVGNDEKGYEGKIYVLVDYNTRSQSEYTAMAFQLHPNTVVIGGQTAGADGNVTYIPMPYGIKSYFSGLQVFYPDGTPTQRIGVNRDYKVVQNSTYLEGKDLIFEKALELMRTK